MVRSGTGILFACCPLLRSSYLLLPSTKSPRTTTVTTDMVIGYQDGNGGMEDLRVETQFLVRLFLFSFFLYTNFHQVNYFYGNYNDNSSTRIGQR